MARKRASTGPLRFRGPPGWLQALAPPTLAEPGSSPPGVILKLPRKVASIAPLPLSVSAVGEVGLSLAFTLPETTPPGSYDGTVHVGEQKYPMVADVEADPNVVISPDQLELRVAPGAEEVVHLSVLNAGNVACEVGRADAFGLFDVAGAERGIRAALGGETRKGERRVDRLADELADAHGGLVRMQVREGSGTIEPGELRHLRVALRFSDRLQPGHTYSGAWRFHDLRYYVRVEVTGSTGPEKGAE